MKNIRESITLPVNSESYQNILTIAEEHGVDTNMLREIFWQLTAHSHLIAFVQVATNLLWILDNAPASWKHALESAGIAEWRQTLEWVVREKVLLEEKVGEHISRPTNSNGYNPTRGHGLSVFSTYSTLCEPVNNRPIREQYLLIVGQFIIAHIIGIRNTNLPRHAYESYGVEHDWKFLPNGVQQAAIGLRRLSESRFEKFLNTVDASVAPENFAQSIAPTPNTKSDNDQEVNDEAVDRQKTDEQILFEDLVEITRFMKKCRGQLDWIERSGRRSSTGKGHRWVGSRMEYGMRVTLEKQELGDSEDPKDSWGFVDVVRTRSSDIKTIQSYLDSDLSPDEDDEDDEMAQSHEDCKEAIKDAGSSARSARAKARYISTANQILPWSYGSLAYEEISNVITILLQEYAFLGDRNTWSKAQRQKAEAIVFIFVMLWTGSDEARAEEVRICHEAQAIQTGVGIVIPANGNVNKICWRIAALQPEYRSNQIGIPLQIRRNVEYFDLPDMVGIAHMIDDLIATNKYVDNKRPLLTSRLTQLKEKAKDLLNQWFPGNRITLTKISHVLWNQIAAEIGDPAVASSVTGCVHTLARIRLFYTTLSTSSILRYYTTAATRIVKASGMAEERIPSDARPWMPNMQSETSVGARNCPTVGAVRNLFEGLRAAISKASEYTNSSEFAKYHNLYTLFTIQYFAYATSCRAVVTPYAHLSEIHESRGVAVISDKDNETNHKSRLVPIHPSLLSHMRCYAEHLEVMKRQMPSIPEKFKHEPCYFLDENFRSVQVRPKTIEPLLKPFLDVRANTHRRFLRTELIEMGCPHEVVDAFLGHWQRGEEPFGTYSSFSFSDYIVILNQYLEKLFNKIGLTGPLRSRAVV